VPASTVRYYERAGILRPSRRSASNYRLYGPEELHRLRFIRAAQATGFTLRDVRELLRPAGCGDVQSMIGRRLALLDARLRDLRHVRGVLRESLALCREHERSGRCRVIESLSERAAGLAP
jgi:DNA-binding transcriptional MerR regulator